MTIAKERDAIATAPAPQSPVPAIDPRHVFVDHNGHCSRNLFVRLPAGFTADHLKEPSAWRRVQAGEKAVKKFDNVRLVDFDEAWLADGVIESANATTAILAGIKIVQMGTRTTPLFSDGVYRVVWGGAGFHVERIKDGAKVTATVANEQLAERDLKLMYPTKVGAVA
jgi:hypothetical protein